MHTRKHDADTKHVPTSKPTEEAKTLVVHHKGGIDDDVVREGLKCHKISVLCG
jgi:hypothetical protein